MCVHTVKKIKSIIRYYNIAFNVIVGYCFYIQVVGLLVELRVDSDRVIPWFDDVPSVRVAAAGSVCNWPSSKFT